MDSQERVLAYLQGEMDEDDRRGFEEQLARSAELRSDVESGRRLLDLMVAASEEAVVRSVNEMIREAIQDRASDIHILPGTGPDEDAKVFFRTHQGLHEARPIPRPLYRATADRWKMLCDASLEERRRPQDGRVAVTQEGKPFDLRVTFLPTLTGERITVRILDANRVIPRLDELSIPAVQRGAMQGLFSLPRGFVAFSGLPGSGKTTTLLSLLEDRRDRGEREGQRQSIFTVEDPVWFPMPGISQVPVDRSAGLSHLEALRAVFRSDLDIVYVDQLPDRDTLLFTQTMAMTGHLVIAQLDQNGALGALEWLLEETGDRVRMAQDLSGIIAQLLLPRNCPHCREEYAPAGPAIDRLGLTEADGPFRRGAGCAECGGRGIQGRVALWEILTLDDDQRDKLASGASLSDLVEQGLAGSGGSLREQTREQVKAGSVTAEHASRALFSYSRGS